MTAALPKWVYDVVIALQEWEYTHPPLFGDFYDGMRELDDCGCKAYHLVPADVRAQAAVLKGYVASKEATE